MRLPDPPTEYDVSYERARNRELERIIRGVQADARANIVGIVSQENGAPTGAVIEYGTNANGEFTRFADGTQICSGEVAGGSYPTAVTLPAAFINADYVVVGAAFDAMSTTLHAAKFGSLTTTDMECALVEDSGGGPGYSSVALRYLAIGRWF